LKNKIQFLKLVHFFNFEYCNIKSVKMVKSLKELAASKARKSKCVRPIAKQMKRTGKRSKILGWESRKAWEIMPRECWSEIHKTQKYRPSAAEKKYLANIVTNAFIWPTHITGRPKTKFGEFLNYLGVYLVSDNKAFGKKRIVDKFKNNLGRYIDAFHKAVRNNEHIPNDFEMSRKDKMEVDNLLLAEKRNVFINRK